MMECRRTVDQALTAKPAMSFELISAIYGTAALAR